MSINATDVPRVADGVEYLCRSRDVDMGTYARMLGYAGDALVKGGTVDDALALVRRALESAGFPPGADELPPLEG